MTTKWELEQHLEDEEHPWILEKLKIALMKTEDQDVSTATHMDIWQENVGNLRRKKRRGNATSVTK